MIKNYFKTAWRNLLQNKGLAFINILGLSMGMAFAILIGMWIVYETGYDTFHKNGNRIAMVLKNTLFNNEKNTQQVTPTPLRDELKKSFPEVEKATRSDWGSNHSLIVNDKKFNKEGRFVDPDFLDMFSFPLLAGNKETALNDPNSIILTETLAKNLFGNEDPMGKTIRIDNQYPFQVTGIVKDVPSNSTITFQYLAPYEFLVQTIPFIKNNQNSWSNNSLMTMVELKEGVSMESFSKKIASLNMRKDSTLKNQTLFLHPMAKWHLRNEYKNWVNVGGKIEYVRLFGIIGLFVLLIACINFMNLSTARSEKRAREVGVRKAIGSARGQLILQFLSEAVLTTFLAFLLSIGLIKLLLPLLKDMGFEHIHFNLGNISLLAVAFVVCLVTGLIAGSYPALYLSSFAPVRVLKGAFRQGKGPAAFRKVLVVSQFAISTGLIISSVIVFQQINHAKDRSLGYDPNNMISIECTRDLADNYVTLKQELLNTGDIEAVAKVSNPMTRIYNRWGDFSWDGKPPGSDIALDAVMTEWDFDKAAGLKFVEGRPFSINYKTDSNAVILNEAAIRVMGYKNPIGRTMKSGNNKLTIIGVVKDVLISDPFVAVEPTAILFNGNPRANVNIILLRFKPSANIKASLSAIQPIFGKYNPSMPFEYKFVSDEFEKKFYMENQVVKLAGIFAVLAILISCMGLFGLASFMAERRTREIGIRKVLGASVSTLWVLLSREFVWLVLIACVIASPLTFWFMKDWLQKYDYRINISWWVFAIAGALAVVVSIITVSAQAIKAAVANPVKSLRTE